MLIVCNCKHGNIFIPGLDRRAGYAIFYATVRKSAQDSATRRTTMQSPRKHFESGGALAKRGTFVDDQNQTIFCLSRAEGNFLKIWSLYNVRNILYRVFTTAKRALSFQQCQKRAFIQEILFSFFKRGTLAQKKGHFFPLLKKCVGGGGHWLDKKRKTR